MPLVRENFSYQRGHYNIDTELLVMYVKCAVSPYPLPTGVWIVSFGYMMWQHCCFFPL